jgi:hypothetical protein
MKHTLCSTYFSSLIIFHFSLPYYPPLHKLPPFTLISRTQLTTTAGWHSVSVNLTKNIVADVFSSASTPLQMSLYTLDTVHRALRSPVLITNSIDDCPRFKKEAWYRENIITPVFQTIRSTDDKVRVVCVVH